MESEVKTKPTGGKAYGSIGHLPQSRMGPGDHSVAPGQGAICTAKTRDKHDLIIVQEKLDGSCVAVAKVNGALHPLGRAGWPAVSSPYEQHRLFHDWVFAHWQRFEDVLQEGERIVGEWLAQAHGTRYELAHEPFVAFDIIKDGKRLPLEQFIVRCVPEFVTPRLLWHTNKSLSVSDALEILGEFGSHGAVDPVEGVMYRVERRGVVDFLAKYVRPDKKDGIYLPEIGGQEPVWNWRP